MLCCIVQFFLFLSLTCSAQSSSAVSDPIPAPNWRTLNNDETQIIGHRGDAFYMPGKTRQHQQLIRERKYTHETTSHFNH